MSSPSPDRARTAARLAVLVAALAIGACEREARDFPHPGPGADVGGLDAAATMVARYEHNAYALANGKRLWTWYNCSGCHAAGGGGGSGPALMDDSWIYGGGAREVYQSIFEGRPNGMPAFGGRIPTDQIWQLAAYVRSMAGLAPQDAAPNRDDALVTRTPESFSDSQKTEDAKPSARNGKPL